MATAFEIVVADHQQPYARQAAAAAFREIDRLENELSRYIESSDISRANRMACGDTLTIGHDALECLLLAADLSLATGRTFDAGYASVRSADFPSDLPPFTLNPEAHTITSCAVSLRLDLGAIGKGFALDRAVEVLRQWNIQSACLNSGGSTVFALGAPAGEPGWWLGVGEGPSHVDLAFVDVALSGSGTAVKGAHLMDPRSGGVAPRNRRVWALAPGAAQSDALSTAFFVMSAAEIARFCSAHPTIGAAYVDEQGRLRADGSLAAMLQAAEGPQRG
jgi:thiamine biosynthesis lipoprotein